MRHTWGMGFLSVSGPSPGAGAAGGEMDATGSQDTASAITCEALEGPKAEPGAEPASRQSAGAAEPKRIASAEILLP